MHRPKIKTTPTQQFCPFLIANQVTKSYILRVYMQMRGKTGITIFFRILITSAEPESRRFQIISRNGLAEMVYHGYIYHFLFKDEVFLHLTSPRRNLFSYILSRSWKWIWPHCSPAAGVYSSVIASARPGTLSSGDARGLQTPLKQQLRIAFLVLVACSPTLSIWRLQC